MDSTHNTKTQDDAEGSWKSRRSVVEFYTSLVGLFASSTTLVVTLAGIFLLRPQATGEAEVVRYVISLPFWEALVLQMADQMSASMSDDGSGSGIDTDQLKRALEEAGQVSASPIRDNSLWAFFEQNALIALGVLGVAAGILVVSIALFFRSRR